MKRAILMIVAILVMAGAARAQEPNVPVENDRAITLWVSGSDLGYQNTDLSAWLGLRQKNVEFGVATEWRMFSEGDTNTNIQSQLSIGPYGVYHFPGLIDVNNPLDVEWLPEKFVGEPFISLSYLIDTKGQGAAISPGIGIRLFDSFALFWDYSFYKGIPADNQGRIGLSAKWDF